MTVNSVGATLAKQGLQSMFAPDVRLIQDQARIGDTYMGQIASQSTDPLEKAVAQVGVGAWNDMNYADSQVGISEATLDAVSAGVSGPVGNGLASVGKAAMFSKDVTNIQDQARMGEHYVSAEASQGNAAQQAVAGTALNAWQQMRYADAQVGIDEAALDACNGAAGQPTAGLLAHAGYNAMYNHDISNIQDQAVIGLVFAAGVRDNTSDAGVKAQAQAALDAANNVAQASSQVDILGNFLRGVQ